MTRAGGWVGTAGTRLVAVAAGRGWTGARGPVTGAGRRRPAATPACWPPPTRRPALLDAAALLTVGAGGPAGHRGAAARGRRRRARRGPAGAAAPAPTAAPEPPSARSAARLARADDRACWPTCSTAAAAAGYRAPAPLLPALLDAAVRDAGAAARGGRRCSAPAAAGWPGTGADWQRVRRPRAGRGRTRRTWTASVWRTGSRGERRGYLAALRTRDPAAARDLLAAGWARRDRRRPGRLLRVLARGLSAGRRGVPRGGARRPQAARSARPRRGCWPGCPARTSAAGRRSGPRRCSGWKRRAAPHAGRPACPAAGRRPRPGTGSTPPRRAGIGAGGLAAHPADRGRPARPLDRPVRAGPGRDRGPAGQPGTCAADVHAGWRLAAVNQASPDWAEALLARAADPDAGRRPPAARLAGATTSWPRCCRRPPGRPGPRRCWPDGPPPRRRWPARRAARSLAGCPGRRGAGACCAAWSPRRPASPAAQATWAAAALPGTGHRGGPRPAARPAHVTTPPS